MKCTANILSDLTHRTMRCERELGHPGLHRYTFDKNNIQEFPDEEAYFPWYRKEEEPHDEQG